MRGDSCHNPTEVKRIARHIFNAITALSLLLCLATADLWLRALDWRWHWVAGEYAGSFVVCSGRDGVLPDKRIFV